MVHPLWYTPMVHPWYTLLGYPPWYTLLGYPPWYTSLYAPRGIPPYMHPWYTSLYTLVYTPSLVYAGYTPPGIHTLYTLGIPPPASLYRTCCLRWVQVSRCRVTEPWAQGRESCWVESLSASQGPQECVSC